MLSVLCTETATALRQRRNGTAVRTQFYGNGYGNGYTDGRKRNTGNRALECLRTHCEPFSGLYSRIARFCIHVKILWGDIPIPRGSIPLASQSGGYIGTREGGGSCFSCLNGCFAPLPKRPTCNFFYTLIFHHQCH